MPRAGGADDGAGRGAATATPALDGAASRGVTGATRRMQWVGLAPVAATQIPRSGAPLVIAPTIRRPRRAAGTRAADVGITARAGYVR